MIIVKSSTSKNIEEIFKKYEAIPTDLKYLLIEKDFNRMYGKRFTQDKMKYMYDDTETFIFNFENALCYLSKAVKKNILKKYFEELSSYEYPKLLESGMFFEFFPTLSGEWLKDKEFFINFIAERESKKEYVKLILG